ncbi:MAG: hypothetical protein IJV85_02925 [Clostridia bacterium]|nr:hypothetical protein [Clostridia bacterium]
MQLAKNEKLIKAWDYASSKVGGAFRKVETKAKIEVTDKRLVYTAQSKRAIERQEIPLKEVNAISYKQQSKGNLWVIIKLIFFGILSVVLVGIPGFIRTWKELNQGSFEMTVTTKGLSTEALSIGVSKIFAKARKASKVKIIINKEVVGDIIETLGSIIVESVEAAA